MVYPHFQVPYLGQGMVIGGNAVIHVILSHGLAIGAFLAIAIAELIGYLRGSKPWEHFAHHVNKPVTILISSFGAVTGVGIWFTIGVLAPRAATSMLHIFFWPWFMEWIVFVMEACILVAYYFLWDRMTVTPRLKKLHIAMGFAYVGLAFVSNFLIVGIIGFMLTPDGWPWHNSLFYGFFNPSLWPQIFIRFFGGIALGLLIVYIFLIRWTFEPEFERAALRLYGLLFLIFSIATGLCVWWYFRNVPDTFKTHKIFAMLTSHFSQTPQLYYIVNAIALGLVLLPIVISLARWRFGASLFYIPALLAGFFLVAEFERTREFIRGPYVMPGYMYASQVLIKESPYFNQVGSLKMSYWFNSSAYPDPDFRQIGQTLFGNNCMTCHTIGGLNDIRDRLRGRPQDAIAVIEAHTRQMVPFMPPFSGSTQERMILSQYLHEITTGRLSQSPPSRYPMHKDQDHD